MRRMPGAVASGCWFGSWNLLGCANRDEQMSNGYPFSLLNDEQMSNKVRVEHQPVYQFCMVLEVYLRNRPFTGHLRKKKTRCRTVKYVSDQRCSCVLLTCPFTGHSFPGNGAIEWEPCGPFLLQSPGVFQKMPSIGPKNYRTISLKKSSLSE